MVHKWGNVRIDRKGRKAWVEREYSTLTPSRKTSRTILVYDDRDYGYGWRVWKGKTDGSDKGLYWSFPSRKKALAFAKKLMKGDK